MCEQRCAGCASPSTRAPALRQERRTRSRQFKARKQGFGCPLRLEVGREPLIEADVGRYVRGHRAWTSRSFPRRDPADAWLRQATDLAVDRRTRFARAPLWRLASAADDHGEGATSE